MNIVLYAPAGLSLPSLLPPLSPHAVQAVQGELKDIAPTLTALVATPPGLVVVAGWGSDPSAWPAVEALCRAWPHTTVAAHWPEAQPQDWLQLMQIGVREVAPAQGQAAWAPLLERAQRRWQLSQPQHSKVLGVWSCKDTDLGGCVAANLAQAASELSSSPVLLIDLNLPFGDVDMHLSPPADTKDLADIAAEVDRLDASLLHSLVHRVNERLHVVVSPSSLDKVMSLQHDHVRRLIGLCARHYPLVVLDLGAGFDPLTLSVLPQLDEVVVLTANQLPALRRASHQLRLLKALEVDEARIVVAANTAADQGPLSAADIEQVLGRRLDRPLKSDPQAIHEALVVGQPLVTCRPRSPLSPSLQQWAADLLGVAAQRPTLWQRLKSR